MSDSSQRVRVSVSEAPIDSGALIAEVGDPESGASVLFLGTVRDHSDGKTGVTHLSYEVFDELVEPKIAEIVDEACEKWPVVAVVVEHRFGDVMLGETSVAVAVSSAHRADAFDAGEFIIDELKVRAPIWKKEFWSGGAEWSRGS
jgi:molybdopterin synthase catalytic subunit